MWSWYLVLNKQRPHLCIRETLVKSHSLFLGSIIQLPKSLLRYSKEIILLSREKRWLCGRVTASSPALLQGVGAQLLLCTAAAKTDPKKQKHLGTFSQSCSNNTHSWKAEDLEAAASHMRCNMSAMEYLVKSNVSNQVCIKVFSGLELTDCISSFGILAVCVLTVG